MGRIKQHKTISRTMTRRTVDGTYGINKFPIKENFCQSCKTIKNLQLHHEIYPRYVEDIRRAIKKKRIYYLCKSCHKKRHGGLKS